MKNVIILIAALFTSTAFADGFVCQSNDGVLKVKAYNHVHAAKGTRTAAVMIVSDNTIQHGNKTIAKFDSVEGLLDNSGAEFVAQVDLRFNNTGRKGELIGGTKLGQLDSMILSVPFSYGSPVEAGEELDSTLILVKRDGSKIAIDMTCARYLKN
jgi:hypothetical protein